MRLAGLATISANCLIVAIGDGRLDNIWSHAGCAKLILGYRFPGNTFTPRMLIVGRSGCSSSGWHAPVAVVRVIGALPCLKFVQQGQKDLAGVAEVQDICKASSTSKRPPAGLAFTESFSKCCSRAARIAHPLSAGFMTSKLPGRRPSHLSYVQQNPAGVQHIC